MGWHDKEKEGRGPRFVQKKKLHRTRLSSGQWVLPKNYNNLNQIKANFIIKKNWIEEYEYDKGWYYINYGHNFDKESSKSDSDSDSEIEKKKKKDIKSERNVVVFINTLQSLITSATNYIMNWIALLKVEWAVGLACLLKIECTIQKCKQTNNNPTMPLTKKVDRFMK